jgi:hypothetical protein
MWSRVVDFRRNALAGGALLQPCLLHVRAIELDIMVGRRRFLPRVPRRKSPAAAPEFAKVMKPADGMSLRWSMNGTSARPKWQLNIKLTATFGAVLAASWILLFSPSSIEGAEDGI